VMRHTRRDDPCQSRHGPRLGTRAAAVN
jgi:hypothetical protein